MGKRLFHTPPRHSLGTPFDVSWSKETLWNPIGTVCKFGLGRRSVEYGSSGASETEALVKALAASNIQYPAKQGLAEAAEHSASDVLEQQ